MPPERKTTLTGLLPVDTMVSSKALSFVVAKKMQPFCFVATLITREWVRVSYSMRPLPVDFQRLKRVHHNRLLGGFSPAALTNLQASHPLRRE
jgi:hypothetical protein